MWPFSKPKPQHSCWKTHLLIFLAGAQAFHTLVHILFTFSDTLPIYVWGMEWTQAHNVTAIIINGLITLGLLYWASKDHHSH